MTLNRKRAVDPDFEEEPVADRKGIGCPLRSFLVFLLFLAGAFLVFGALVSRTAGFREILSVKNQEWTQTRVQINDSRIAWPYDLVLNGVTLSKDAAGRKDALKIPGVRVQWRPGSGLEIRMERPEVRLEETADGAFLPEELAFLGQIRDAAGVAEWLRPLGRTATLHLEGASLEVCNSAGARIRRLENIRLSCAPVALPGRSASHVLFAGGPMKGSGGDYDELRGEWLFMEGTGVVELAFSMQPAGKPWGRDFWKGLQP